MATNNTNTYQPYPMNSGMSTYATTQYQPTVMPVPQLYQPQYPTSVPLQNQQPQPQYIQSERVWVEGETSAKSYLVGRNREQVLWDSESPVIYIKTVDATGKPTTVVLDYTIRPEQTQSDGVANSEVSDLKKEIAELKDAIKGLVVNQQPTKTYKPKYNKEVAE